MASIQYFVLIAYAQMSHVDVSSGVRDLIVWSETKSASILCVYELRRLRGYDYAQTRWTFIAHRYDKFLGFRSHVSQMKYKITV